MNRFRLNFIATLCVLIPILAMVSLYGCGENKNIIPASTLTSGQVTLSWNDVPEAVSYDLHLSTSPGVTALNAFRIAGVTSPMTITDLEPGTTYYFMVVAVDESGKGKNSKELSYTVTETEGLIDFEDLFLKSKTDSKFLESGQVQLPTSSDENIAEKIPVSEAPQVGTDKPDYEIIICFGDSLTFGIGASMGMDYPSQLERMIQKPVINEGLPGDTTAWALKRLRRDVLSKNPDIVLITLGGNDLKNGVSKDIAFSNLKKIVQSIQERGAKVIIGGLKFTHEDRGFGRGYEKLAEQTGAILIPNILEGIFGNRILMSDPIHPNNEGYTIISRRFFKAMVP